MTRKILMPVRTVAEWGGVHEWTVDAARSFINAGHTVTFVGQGELFEKRARATGADFLEIDWADWKGAAETVAADPRARSADLVFAHAPHARMLGLEVSRRLGIELYVMIHGAYHDYMYTWSQHATGFLAASPSLVHFTHRFGRVEPWKVALVPNAAPDAVFDLPVASIEERTQNGVGHIVTAARLARDKLSQIQPALETIATCAELRPDIQWRLDVYGDGPERDTFERAYRSGLRSIPNADVTLHGWAEPHEIPLKMRDAVVGIAAGMTGVRTIAAGALCVGVGARNFVGVQQGPNLRAGLWSNFGDHGTMRFTATDLTQDLRTYLDPAVFDESVLTAREIVRRTNSQTVVDGAMFSALQC